MNGEEARALREQTGYSLVAWAALLGINAQSARNIEAGNRQAGKALEQLWKITAQRRKKRPKHTNSD